jgi:3-hydroxy-9,10-secoandrosta-1,3,5(10)-triene-9,17-dione monooxygenase
MAETSQRASKIPSREELLARAEALVPVLRERSDRAEEMRSCPAETVADYVANGFLRICQPARYGGYELGWDVRSEVGQVLARGCGSQAWIQHILTDHTQKLGAFDERAQDDVWREYPDTRIAAGLDPVGRARRVAGGVVYSGRHGFSSGIDHVQWLICGGHVFEGEKPVQRCFFLVPKSDITVIDDWHVMGLAGTGSKSFAVNEAFVPEHRILDAFAADDATGPGLRVNAAPVFRIPFQSIAGTGFAAITVGIAEGFLEEWVGYTRGRSSRGMRVAELMGTHMDAGRAAIEIDTARRLYLEAARETMATLARGERLGDAQRLRARTSSALAGQLARTAVERLYNAAGGRANYNSNVLQRRVRDVQAAASHISMSWNPTMAAYGGQLLGSGAIDWLSPRARPLAP